MNGLILIEDGVMIKSGKRDDVVLIRLRLGHCGLASYMKDISKLSDGIDEFGNLQAQQDVFSCNK